jgi:alkylation response protein AidB-like acyl-CoA dehydrogenase
MDSTLKELRLALANFLDREVAAGAILGEAQTELDPRWIELLGNLGFLDFSAGDDSDGLGLVAEAIVVAEVARVWGALAVAVAASLLAARALSCAPPGHGLNGEAVRAGRSKVAIGRLSSSIAPSSAKLVLGAPAADIVLLLPSPLAFETSASISAGPPSWPEGACGYEGLRGLHGATLLASLAPTIYIQDSAELLAADRILLSAAAAGLAQGALDQGVAYAAERIQFGRPIGAYGEIQALLVRASTQALSARHGTLYAAQLFDGRERSIANATAAYLNATEAAVRVAERVQHVHGGYGHMAEFSAGRYVRDARTLASVVGSHSDLDRYLARELELPQ